MEVCTVHKDDETVQSRTKFGDTAAYNGTLHGTLANTTVSVGVTHALFLHDPLAT
jgi:hypothetical protein